MKSIKFLTLALICLLGACGEKTHTVEDFRADENLRNKYIEQCNNGEIDHRNLNCENSKVAELIEGNLEDTKDLPSLLD